MYHALTLEDMLDLVNITRCFATRLSSAQRRQVADWHTHVRGLHAWLLAMCHPDGEISFFNDSSFDIAPSVTELDGYARRVMLDLATHPLSGLTHLRESGYIRLARGPAVALLDVAPLGPDYMLGHAHADTLSFELSVGTQRVLVNSGVSCYGSSAERLRQRGTAAHNTVVLNGQNSSEVWGGFRVARRAFPFGLKFKETTYSSEVICAHSGYVRLPGRPVHHRTWRLDAFGLSVIDRVEGPYQRAEARFHFHPALKVEIDGCKSHGTIILPDGAVLTWQLNDGTARLEPSTWHPRFGSVEPNLCMTVHLVDGRSAMSIRWDKY
jgi:uncharacterized heparinase superfamily protein